MSKIKQRNQHLVKGAIRFAFADTYDGALFLRFILTTRKTIISN